MHHFSIENENHCFRLNTNDNLVSFQNGDFNIIMNLYSTNDLKNFNIPKNLLNNKREKDNNKKTEVKHTKYYYDSLKRKCKHLVIDNVMQFINNKIYEEYDGKIDNGITKKKLMKLNQSQKTNADVEFNKTFIKKTLKEIFSENLTKKIKLYEKDHNKKIIDSLLSEKKEEFEKIFNLSFIECVEHFVGNKTIEALNGMKLFSDLKEQIINKYEEDGESYYENLKIFLKGFEDRINRAKSRKKRTKKF